MATSGGVNTSTVSGDGSYWRLEWETQSQSIPNNRSTVKWTLWVYCGVSYQNNALRIDYVNVNGTQVKGSQTYSNYSRGWHEMASNTINITHNTDGTKTFAISLSGWFYSNYTVTGSGSGTLDRIPRASVIGTVSNFNFEDAFSVPITKYSDTFKDTLELILSGTTIKSITDYTSGATIQLTDAELLSAYSLVGTSNKSATATFKTTTKSGTTTIGTNEKTATGTIAGTAKVRTSGSWKRAVPWVKIGGTWKRSIAKVRASNSWKRGL